MDYARVIKQIRWIILFSTGAFMFTAGAYLALPRMEKEFARVDMGGVVLLAEVARTPEALARGLSGRPCLTENKGMLFMFSHQDKHAIWMKGMRCSIDIFWIRDGKVVDMVETAAVPNEGISDAALPRYTPDVAADFVLEIAVGFAATHQVRIGDRVGIDLKGYRAPSDEIKTASPDEYNTPAAEKYYIETLLTQGGRGKDFYVGEELVGTDAYQKYRITYLSDGLTISGIMNVPRGAMPFSGFPTLVLNHGLIPPASYISGRGSKREQDFFARHGYVTIHPDYRGHASSSPHSFLHHDFYVGYSRDVMNFLDALSSVKPTFIDLSRLGMWGHSMGGGIASRVMVLRPEIRAYVLFAPISADAEENFYELPSDEIAWLRVRYDAGEKGRAHYDKISPFNYFNKVSAPVQLHHGTEDADVPIAFSESIYRELNRLGKKVEFFVYPEQKHEFIEDWPLAAERALQFFDKYVKRAP